MFDYEEILKGFVYDGEDVYKLIYDELGIDIKDDPNYYVGFGGASDNDGISETMFTTFVVYKKRLKKELYSQNIPHDLTKELRMYEIPRKTEESKEIYMTESTSTDTQPEELLNEEIQKENEIIEDLTLSVMSQDSNINDEVEIIQTPIDEQKNLDEEYNKKTIKVVRRIKNRMSVSLATIALVLAVLAPLGINNIKSSDIPPAVTEQIVQVESDLTYDINQSYSFENLISDINMGGEMYLPDGLMIYDNSLQIGIKEKIGDPGFRQQGNYEITGFSIVKDGKIVDYIENFDGSKMEANLGNYVTKVCSERNLKIDDLNIFVHFGNSTNYTRTGWVDCNELVNVLIDSHYRNYSGTIENFVGNSIQVQGLNGNVTIPVCDNNGNFYKNGDTVIGSDGNEYKISNLNVEKVVNQSQSNQISTGSEASTLDSGYSITYSVSNVTISELALISALASSALLIAAGVKKKNEELENTPFYDTYEKEEEYRKVLAEFKSAQDNYNNKSKFQKIMNFFFKREEKLYDLTNEQIEQLYQKFTKLHTASYSYLPGDQLMPVSNGRFIVIRDGEEIEITHELLGLIKSIANEDEPTAIGTLKGEKEEAFNELIKDEGRRII